MTGKGRKAEVERANVNESAYGENGEGARAIPNSVCLEGVAGPQKVGRNGQSKKVFLISLQ